MDYIEKGKQLAQENKYEEALDAFMLALENDRENPDVHFYIGLCYSSLEEFGYAKYHYKMALSLDPEHQKTKMVWDGIKDVTPEKPPEKRKTRSAAQKAQKEQQTKQPKEEELPAQPKSYSLDVEQEPSSPQQDSHTESSDKKFKITDEKWEKAFPSEPVEKTPPSSSSGFPTGIVLSIIAVAAIGFLVYYLLVNYL